MVADIFYGVEPEAKIVADALGLFIHDHAEGAETLVDVRRLHHEAHVFTFVDLLGDFFRVVLIRGE